MECWPLDWHQNVLPSDKSIMNSWIVVLCAAVVCCAFVQCDREAHKGKYQECAKENNVSEEELKELKEKSKGADYVPTENVKV